ncbi:hypothetical protein FDG2_4784 [Candidatus Protofrankia californiensis]|uniref:PIN domain-containing protein n=1 Tax=Candidatus Protofrankia californiensis TaxID=1839754 RepID=A0A1C3P8D4_9ACTN|nr:hypothetical protein FDG2_4784 [Candidatus Protofrankia californiensis]
MGSDVETGLQRAGSWRPGAASRRIGRRHGAHDLIIAAHAAETGKIIFGRDAKARFADLPGVLAT